MLVGRDAELIVLRAAAAGVAKGDVHAVVLTGEAGIGKSALLAAAGEEAEKAGLLVLHGRAAEHERDVPFGAVIDALDDHVAGFSPRRLQDLGPDLAAVLPSVADHVDGPGFADGAAERFRYHRALRGLLEQLGRERPVAFVLDDLHWADDATVELVLHLLRRPPRSPLLLIIALRPSEVVGKLLNAGRAAPAFDHFTIAPLTDAAANKLVAHLDDPSLRARVVREAAGNPLFLGELGRANLAPGDPLPSTVLAAVELEVSQLPPGSRQLLEGAAVAGDPFDPELAAAAAGIDEDVLALLDRLAAADLVRPVERGRQFSFRHPLVLRAVYDGAPGGWRITAHERVAAALRARGADTTVLAHHIERSARHGDAEAIRLLEEAGDTSAAVAPAAAVRWYSAAVRLQPGDDVDARVVTLSKLASSLYDAGRLDAARDTLIEVLDLLPPEPTLLRARLIGSCAQVEVWLGRFAEARRRLDEAIADAPPEVQPSLCFSRGTVENFLSQWEDGLAWAERGREHLDPVADPALAIAIDGLESITAWYCGRHDQSRRALDSLRALMTTTDDGALAGRLLDSMVAVGTSLMFAEDFVGGRDAMTRGLAIARATGQGRAITPVATTRVQCLYNLLELDAALADAETAVDSARLLGASYQLCWALAQCAMTHHFRGEAAQAAEHAAEVSELAPGLQRDIVVIASTNVASIIRMSTDPEQGLRDLVESAGDELQHANPTWVTFLMGEVVRAYLVLERPDDAALWAERVTAHADALELPAGRVRAMVARAEVQLARGEAAAAAELAQDAVAFAEEVGALRDAATARVVAGRAVSAAGDRDEAIAILRRAAADAGRGSALRLRDEASRELRRLGARLDAGSRRTGSGGMAELTNRERDIAELVAAGKANKQVAASLFISEKTVEYHLSNLYAKLGVRSRVELASTLDQR